MILVVGGGLAGLTCAKALHEAGREVRILEAADAPGGRVRTDQHRDGFLLDRGFFTLLTAYPTVRRHLDLAALRPCALKPGAVIVRGGKWHETGDPWPRHSLLGLTAGSPMLPAGDKMRLAKLQGQARGLSVGSIFTSQQRDRSALEELAARGFTRDEFIQSFAAPYLGGVFLDRKLESSARLLLFTIKMLAEGDVALPASGIGAIAGQLAAGLPAGAVRCGMRVEGIVEADERAVGVTLPGGEEMQGEAVVIATDAATAHRLTRRELPCEPVAATCLYFASDRPLYAGARLLVNADPRALVSHALQISNVAPGYAPAGQHLLAVALAEAPAASGDLAAQARTELAAWFPGQDPGTLRHLATYAVPHARYRQPAGIFATLPPNATPTRGLFLAGDFTESSTLHGAMHSGEKAAAAVLEELHAE
ncbi:MAG TPA: NAD(P)/FAD-dependent oxidoreductase [Ktedonobacterales bacterium]|nr:NAD(P)/FAD-dependent oxidoreductase [Ktedonobacterales bacterium]